MVQQDPEMLKFAQIMEGFNNATPDPMDSVDTVTNSDNTYYPQPAIAPPVSMTPKDDAMFNFTNIVDGFTKSMTGAAQEVIEESQHNPILKEALETSVVDDGIKIGKWKIVVNLVETAGQKKKHFDVVHSITNQVIAEDLWLYEAALGLVRFLNRGFPINGKEIKRILFHEENFATHKQDALMFREKVEVAMEKGDHEKVSIYEARFDFSKDKALRAKKSITQLTESAIK